MRTGALAAGGSQLEEGIHLFLKQQNSMIAGRKVELIIADTGGNPVLNMYIRKVERKDGQLVSFIVETLPEVSQFWTFDPKAFLAAPTYSRDVPAAKYPE